MMRNGGVDEGAEKDVKPDCAGRGLWVVQTYVKYFPISKSCGVFIILP
jgi:hypothetical protein